MILIIEISSVSLLLYYCLICVIGSLESLRKAQRMMSHAMRSCWM